jgi:hypothetical protein
MHAYTFKLSDGFASHIFEAGSAAELLAETLDAALRLSSLPWRVRQLRRDFSLSFRQEMGEHDLRCWRAVNADLVLFAGNFDSFARWCAGQAEGWFADATRHGKAVEALSLEDLPF